jgi:predicted alpha/beta superfamily hydrolase
VIRRKPMLVILATAVVSVAVTLLALKIFENEPPVEGAVSATVRSAVLSEDREYFVHLPEGYESDSTRRFPVMYVLDGTSQSGHAAASASLMARVGLIPPMIVVGVPSVDGDTRNRDYTPPDMRLDTDDAASQNGAADRFLSHLETELIPGVEREYRTTRPRMLAGWSRGALFVVYSQIAAPATFDARFAHSPALWRESSFIVKRLEQSFSASAVPEAFLFLSLGDGENEKMTAAFRNAVGMLERSAPPTIRWKAHLSVRGTHDSNPRLSTPVGLCAMFNPERTCGHAQSAGSFAPK